MSEIVNLGDHESVESRALPLNEYLTFAINRLESKLAVQAARHLKEVADLSIPKYRVVTTLGRTGIATFTELAEQMEIDRGALSRTLKSMTEEGLIIRTVNERDHREQTLKLTEVGWQNFEVTRERMEARQLYLRNLLTEDELTNFFTVCRKLSLGAEAKSFD